MAAVSSFNRSYARRHSPSSAMLRHPNAEAGIQTYKRVDVSDSDSDDEPPPALRFSKVTQALLAEDPLPSSPLKQTRAYVAPALGRSASTGKAGLDTPSRAPGIKVVRKTSPSTSADARGQTPPRVVRVGSKGPESAKRSISVSGPYPYRPAARDPTPEPIRKSEYITPGPRFPRSTRPRAGSDASENGQVLSSSRPASRNGFKPSASVQDFKSSIADQTRVISTSQDLATRYAPQTVNRTRNVSADAAPVPNSQRVKRAAPAGAGSLFKSKPIRRGFRRRESEENVSANEEAQSGSASASSYTPQDHSVNGRLRSRSRSASVNGRGASVEPVSAHDFARDPASAYESRPSSQQANGHFYRTSTNNPSRPASRQMSRERSPRRQASVERPSSRRAPSVQPLEHSAGGVSDSRPRRPSVDQMERPAADGLSSQRPSSYRAPQYRYAASKVYNSTADDQENVPPPTFRRNKDQEFKYLGKVTMDGDKVASLKVEETPVLASNQPAGRKALETISSNTPHRPAPAPPPKMSVLDAATTTAGAGVTKSKKKRSHIVINGKIFTQMGKIGKGGSSDVYCVMAENYKTFALKRVKLDDCDEHAVKGFKGEIDLLNKLTEVDRVVRLFDWELNEQKQELAVLMEKGDTDLNRLLTMRLSGADAKFDSAFVRYHWREMLECVQAVHEHDIVHSDLKPANFLFVQGRLKLIDFGIANAIDTDNTCNVHRESHVGTPNYMSPESITDTNAPQPGQMGKDAAGRPLKKDMRIGKSSDVWSLGCILYQMTYGRPPFAHIANQISRIMAITNPKHVIDFPERGMGDVLIPPALRHLLRRCLNRDPLQRPSIPDMLADGNLFGNPDARDDVVLMSQQMLGRIIDKVVERCRDSKRGIPTPDELKMYPASFMNKVRELQYLEGL